MLTLLTRGQQLRYLSDLLKVVHLARDREEILIWVNVIQTVMLFPLYRVASQDKRQNANKMGGYIASKIQTWWNWIFIF